MDPLSSLARFAAAMVMTFVFGAVAAPSNAPPQLSNLLVAADGSPITGRRQWLKQREVWRNEWLEVLGGLPARKISLNTEILNTENVPGFTRQHVRYQVEHGLFTDGFLLTPQDAKGRRPAIVVFHPTTPLQAKGVAGLDAGYPEEKRQGVHLVQRGYVVWCPRNYIFAEGADWKGNAGQVLARHPEWTGMTRMVWDAIRAADFLESLPNVDRRRIGCLGHSLGGKEVLYAMAFDSRYQAGVSSEGGIGLKFSNWSDVWYLGQKINEPGFGRENHEVLALIAPRAFLLLAGNSADNDNSGAFIEAVKPIYALFSAEQNLRFFNHGLGHSYPPEARAGAEEFLDLHLKNSAAANTR
jgi:dienelactone hydrolase